MAGGRKRTQHFWATCFSVYPFSREEGFFHILRVSLVTCEWPLTLMAHFLEESDCPTSHLRSWTFSSFLISLLTLGGQHWAQDDRWGTTKANWKWQNSLPSTSLNSKLFLKQPSMQLACAATRLPLVHQNFQVFLQSYCPAGPTLVPIHWVIFSQIQGFALVFVELWEAFVFLQFEIPLNGSLAPWHILQFPPQVWGYTVIPWPSLLMKMSNKISLSIPEEYQPSPPYLRHLVCLGKYLFLLFIKCFDILNYTACWSLIIQCDLWSSFIYQSAS